MPNYSIAIIADWRIITENFHDFWEIILVWFQAAYCHRENSISLFCRTKKHNNLLFPLCRVAVFGESCSHNDHERSIEVVWCTPQLHTALDYGYKIVKIFKVWHWPQRSKDLFCSYIKSFWKSNKNRADIVARHKSKTRDKNILMTILKANACN